MNYEQNQPPGTYVWHGDKRLDVVKVPDRFTVRLKRGVAPETVASNYDLTLDRAFARQNLVEYKVEASKRDATMEDVRSGPEAQFASHVYTLAQDPTARLYLMDDITVEFKPGVGDAEIERLTADLGLELVKAVPGLPYTYVLRATRQAEANPLKLANQLHELDQVVNGEPNFAVPTRSFYTPADPLYGYQWHLQHSGGPYLAAGSHIDVERAWDITRGQRSVVVAVADDSCDTNHVDFQGQGKIVAPRDLQGRDFDPLPGLPDDNHGTACSGLAVAEENGSGVVGVAPGCALMPVRTSGMIDDNSIEELFDWVREQGAAVVSCSWGAAAVYAWLTQRRWAALHRAATEGRNGLGCVILFAAGNSNRPIDGVVDETGWPDDLLSGPTSWLNGFAAHEDVIAVSASTSQAHKSAYSNWGAEVSVCAPSNNAPPDTYPEVTAALPGLSVVTTDRVGPSGYASADYTYFGGTSAACPIAAGVAALVLSANPDLTAQEVKEILQATADKIEDGQDDPQLGNSLGTYDQAGHSPWFGYGKVNAFGAVQEALRRRDSAPAQTHTKASTPGLAIPDFDSTGVRDTLAFSEPAIVFGLRVLVDITHSYRGDLRLTLTAPSGTAVVLHDRDGGRADDIQMTFDLATTPGLGALVGEPMQGDWTLLVQDLAPADTGIWNRWELEIDVRPEEMVVLEDAPGLTIPDNDPVGIERTLAADASGKVQAVEVSVDITHTFINDLVVALTSPAGTEVLLHDRTGGEADNIITTYTAVTTPGLEALRGEALQGEWKLKVADNQGFDTGKLNHWALHIRREE